MLWAKIGNNSILERYRIMVELPYDSLERIVMHIYFDEQRENLSSAKSTAPLGWRYLQRPIRRVVLEPLSLVRHRSAVDRAPGKGM
jgi:hypothetical protein